MCVCVCVCVEFGGEGLLFVSSFVRITVEATLSSHEPFGEDEAMEAVMDHYTIGSLASNSAGNQTTHCTRRAEGCFEFLN